MTVLTSFRPTMSEGKAMAIENATDKIQGLHAVLSEVVERTGELNGGDTVELIEQWFKAMGMPLPDGDLDTRLGIRSW